MATIYISIGSNIDPKLNIQYALEDLQQAFGDIESSGWYESKSVGFEGDNFINLVVQANTELSITEANDYLHRIEDQHGRDRSGPRFSSRTIDLDLILYDDQIFEQGKLKIPRDEILENAFVLLPLSELAPHLKHPLIDKTYLELWNEFDQASQVLWRLQD